MLIEEIASLIGEIPSGYEPVIYICCILFLLYLLDSFFAIAKMLVNHFLR